VIGVQLISTLQSDQPGATGNLPIALVTKALCLFVSFLILFDPLFHLHFFRPCFLDESNTSSKRSAGTPSL